MVLQRLYLVWNKGWDPCSTILLLDNKQSGSYSAVFAKGVFGKFAFPLPPLKRWPTDEGKGTVYRRCDFLNPHWLSSRNLAFREQPLSGNYDPLFHTC